MPPRDIWDINPVYERVYWQSYCEFLASNSHILGFIPSVLVEESEEVSDDEEQDGMDVQEDEYFDEISRINEDGFEVEELSDSSSDEDDDDDVIDLTIGQFHYGGSENPIVVDDCSNSDEPQPSAWA